MPRSSEIFSDGSEISATENEPTMPGLDKSYEAARFVNCGMEHVQAGNDNVYIYICIMVINNR